MSSKLRIGIIGAGVAGLAAAVDLARRGFDVRLFERAGAPGGKMRQVAPGGVAMDAGPTVFTLRHIFDELFAAAGDRLERHLRLTPAQLLARHAFADGGVLDLHADLERSADAIGAFAGTAEARGFLRFAAQAQRIYAALEHAFIRAPRHSPFGLAQRIGLRHHAELWNLRPFATLWRSLGGYFTDPRLRQLFARYATYCGSSPFAAPATLMLIAHVEQAGVWTVDGGMHALAREMAALAERQGAQLRYHAEVRRILIERGRACGVELPGGERVALDAVLSNADANALASGCFGEPATSAVRRIRPAARSLSAVTWNLVATTTGFELAHHTVFFSADYRAEFARILRARRLPPAPTVYVCAQDRRDDPSAAARGAAAERLLLLMNAPADGDTHDYGREEIEACTTAMFATLAHHGLQVQRREELTQVTTPTDFHRLFPATGGALYGPASHGWLSSFIRPGARSTIPGLYLAGGSIHPGPGVPMAALSGRLAAAAIAQDHASM